MVQVKLTSNMIRAREVLAVLLVFIAGGQSFCYPINGVTSHQFTLCRMLGFFSDVEYYAFLVAAGLAGYTGRKIGPDGKNQLEIYSDEWKGLLTNTKLNLSSDIAEHSVKEFDMEGLIVNNKQQQSTHIKLWVVISPIRCI